MHDIERRRVRAPHPVQTRPPAARRETSPGAAPAPRRTGTPPAHDFGRIPVFPPRTQPPFKTTPTSGGRTGLTLDVTFTVTDTPADSLQVVQTFMGTRRSDGVQVGTYTWQWEGKQWDAFVDGGANSPFVTMGGNPPAHPTQPYYLTPAEVAGQVTWATNAGTVRVFDRPAAVALHDEAYFETAIVAVNHRGTGTDKVLKVFKWGWTGKGATAVFEGKNSTEIAGKPSGIKVLGSVSPEWRNIVKHDYPKYRFT